MGRQIYPASSRSSESTYAMHQEPATMGNLPPRAESIEDEYALPMERHSSHEPSSEAYVVRPVPSLSFHRS